MSITFRLYSITNAGNPDLLHDLFIWGDWHFTALGNEMIARDLIAQYQ